MDLDLARGDAQARMAGFQRDIDELDIVGAGAEAVFAGNQRYLDAGLHAVQNLEDGVRRSRRVAQSRLPGTRPSAALPLAAAGLPLLPRRARVGSVRFY